MKPIHSLIHSESKKHNFIDINWLGMCVQKIRCRDRRVTNDRTIPKPRLGINGAKR